MTETTDIKALPKMTLDELLIRCTDYDDGSLSMDAGELKMLNQHISLLEAERQRADAADSRLHEVSVHCANVEAELAALKGDRVPVSMDSLRDAVAEMSGGLPMEWKEGNDKGHHAVPFINFNSLHRIVTIFTAPQKPVVLPEVQSFLRRIKDKETGGIELHAAQGYYRSAVIAAIEAAGGVVKDGE